MKEVVSACAAVKTGAQAVVEVLKPVERFFFAFRGFLFFFKFCLIFFAPEDEREGAPLVIALVALPGGPLQD